MAARVTTIIGNIGPLYRVGVRARDDNGELLEDSEGNQVFEDLDSNWACRLFINDGVTTIDRAVTARSEDGFRFLAQLTPAETVTLLPGKRTVAIQVDNETTSPPFRIERHIPLELVAQEAT